MACMHVVKGGTHERKTGGCIRVHFLVVVLNDSLLFGVTSGVKNAKIQLCHYRSDECRSRPAVSPLLEWRQSCPCCSAMHSTQAVLTSTHVMCNILGTLG